jgi:hypothetical protein
MKCGDHEFPVIGNWRADKSPPQAQAAIVIKGTIINIGELTKYLSDQTHLRLTPTRADGTFPIIFVKAKGSTVADCDSNLARANLSPDGAFTLGEKQLEAGEYVVCVNGLALPNFGVAPRLSHEDLKRLAVIRIPTNPQKPLVIDLGRLRADRATAALDRSAVRVSGDFASGVRMWPCPLRIAAHCFP